MSEQDFKNAIKDFKKTVWQVVGTVVATMFISSIFLVVNIRDSVKINTKDIEVNKKEIVRNTKDIEKLEDVVYENKDVRSKK